MEFRLPDLGEGLEDAVITAWYVAEGDTVALNQPVCSVETAKAEVDIPSPQAGTIAERCGDVGDTVDVGSVLVRISDGDGDGDGDGSPPVDGETTEGRRPVLVGYGTEERSSSRRRRRRASPPAPAVAAADTGAPARGRPLAKPPVRWLAKSKGIDLAALAPGSGPDGVITRDDVLAAADAEAPAAVRPAASSIQEIPVTGVRARIAAKMTESRSTIPEATCGRWVDASALVEMRPALEDAAKIAVTPFAIIARFTVMALEQNPALNASFDAENQVIRRHGAVHLGIATATDRGLVVPVVRAAHERSMRDLAAEIDRLATAARAGSLTPADLTGSTFTISNFGAFGLDDGNPVINHPEAAILGVGVIKARPWVVGGALAVRHTLKLTCAFDHRVADGAEAGRFVARLASLIETPGQLLADV